MERRFDGSERERKGLAGQHALQSSPERAGREDEARLRSGPMQVVALEAEVAKMSDRGEKVEQLRQALQDGTYQRDDHEVAAALLDDVAARSRLLR